MLRDCMNGVFACPSSSFVVATEANAASRPVGAMGKELVVVPMLRVRIPTVAATEARPHLGLVVRLLLQPTSSQMQCLHQLPRGREP